MRATHTYAVLEISAGAYAEIREKLQAAGYSDQFGKDDGVEVIDMHGIAVQASLAESVKATLAEVSDKARRRF